MQGIQRVLTIIALAYIIYHIYSHGFTTVNIIAAILLIFAVFMELTKKQRRAKIDAYIKRKEEEAMKKEAELAAAEGKKVAEQTDTVAASATSEGVETSVTAANTAASETASNYSKEKAK